MVLSSFALVFGPAVAFAASCAAQGDNGLLKIFCVFADIIGVLVPVLITLAMIYFIWGVIKYVISGDEEEKGKARNMIIYGLIGLVIIVGMWGIVNMVLRTFGTVDNTVNLPSIPGTTVN